MVKKPKKLKRILVATDFSEHSQFAILRAADLARKTKAQLIILHIAKKGFLEKVVEKIVPVVEKILIKPEEYATTLLKKQIEEFSKNEISVKYHIISGDDPAPKILKYARDLKIDLLVIGAHGKYSIHDWFVGTTAEYVVRKTKLPVLIVKNSRIKPYQKILVPIDFSLASQNALQFASQLFSKEILHILHVGDYEYEDLFKRKDNILDKNEKTAREGIILLLKEKICKFIKLNTPKLMKVNYDIKLGYPGMVIIQEAKRLKQDLVLMGTEGHSQRHYLFIGRVASRVLIEIDRDILLVPPNLKNK